MARTVAMPALGAALIAASLVFGAGTASAGSRLAPPPSPASPAVSPPVSGDDAAAMRERLLASQQRIAVLEQQLADEQTRSAQVQVLRARNERLVAIGRDLIASYERRFRRTQKDPLQLGRVRFERELQGWGDQIYTNRADAQAQPDAPTQPDPQAQPDAQAGDQQAGNK